MTTLARMATSSEDIRRRRAAMVALKVALFAAGMLALTLALSARGGLV